MLKDIVFENVLQELNKKFGEKTTDKHYDFLHDLFEDNFIPSEYYKKEKEVEPKEKTLKTKKNVKFTHVPRTMKIIDLPEKNKRCSKGFRHSTNKCYKYVSNDVSSRKTKSTIHRTKKKKVANVNQTRKRCPRGFRKNKQTGICESKI